MDQPITHQHLLVFASPREADRAAFFHNQIGNSPMKTFLSAALGVLFLSTSAMAATPSSLGGPTPENPGGAGVVSTPYTEHAGGSEQMPVFVYTAPAGEPADPVVISTPQVASGSEQEPVFNYHLEVPATRSVDLARATPSDTQISVTANGGR